MCVAETTEAGFSHCHLCSSEHVLQAGRARARQPASAQPCLSSMQLKPKAWASSEEHETSTQSSGHV
eukprot:scaffold84045_cov19-Tisochrysis_lutea.AAC.1